MLNKFAEHLRNLKFSEKTISGYLSDIKNCIKNNITDENLSFFNVEKFQSIILSPQTKHRWSASIKKYAKFLKVKNPLEYESLPRIKRKLHKVVNYKTFKNILDSCDLETRVILSILYSTGCRISSLCNIKIEHINGNKIEIHTAKGDKPYITVLPQETINLINDYKKGRKSGYLFLTKDNKKATPQCIRMRLKRKMGTNYINPHALRHSIATTLAENGADAYTIKEFLNHSSIQTSMRYIHLAHNTIYNKLKTKHPMLHD